jgi:RhoGAP domain
MCGGALFTDNLDDVTRIQSISNLLSTLPAANYKASELLIRHLHELTSSCKSPLNETLPGKIAAVLGPILLRPRVDSTLTVHDKCPHRLVKDLIEFCDAIFSESARESHLHNISRSALIAPTIPQHEQQSAEIDTTTPVPNRRKTIFSYLRSSIKPNDDPDPPAPLPASNSQLAIQKPSRRPIAPPRSSTLFDMDGRASPSKDLFRRSSDTSLFSKRPSIASNPSIVSKSSSSATSLEYEEKEISMSPINVDNIDAFFDD